MRRILQNSFFTGLAALIGLIIASFLALASAEVLASGSNAWMIHGGMYGASVGLPVAMVLGPIGLLEKWPRLRESVDPGERSLDRGRLQHPRNTPFA
jgi:hypothetical protein